MASFAPVGIDRHRDSHEGKLVVAEGHGSDGLAPRFIGLPLLKKHLAIECSEDSNIGRGLDGDGLHVEEAMRGLDLDHHMIA
jgi:hypothetical protein